jgi:phage shock protein PspC (stress-responsive transcriptional regulator)
MKPITTIHLAQRLITIETSALITLQNYLDKLKAYFHTQESGDEIYNDIENRVSEIMDKKLKAGSVCITDADMESIKNTVGSLKDLGIEESIVDPIKEFKTENDETSNAKNATSNTSNNSKSDFNKKLKRNENDKIISGLCSGVATYFNVDPAWVRIIFVLCGFFGGIGIIAYIIGSIVIPTSTDAVFANKRLMRSFDDKIIAGVCSGIAKYFHTTATNIRLLFLAPIILTILFGITDHIGVNIAGPSNGPFLLVYILLWLILPYAQTASEKLQMKGEPVNVNSIRDAVTGNINTVPKTMNTSTTFSNILKAIAFIILGIFGIVFVASFSSIFAAGIAIQPFTEYFFRPGNQQFLAQASWILVFGLPLIVMAVLIIRALVGIKGWPTYVIRTSLLAFGVGIICFLALATDMKNDFKYDSNIPAIQQHELAMDSVIIDLANTNDREFVSFKNGIFNSFNDSLFLENVEVNIVPSKDSNFHIRFQGTANGSTIEEANINASYINYETVLENNKILIPKNYKILKNNLWRNQFVTCEIQVPEGKKVRFTERIIDNPFHKIIIKFMNVQSWNSNSLQDYDANKTYLMQQGKLISKDTVADNENLFSIKAGKDSLEIELKDLNNILDSLGTSREEVIEKTQNAIEKLQEKLENLNDDLEEKK